MSVAATTDVKIREIPPSPVAPTAAATKVVGPDLRQLFREKLRVQPMGRDEFVESMERLYPNRNERTYVEGSDSSYLEKGELYITVDDVGSNERFSEWIQDLGNTPIKVHFLVLLNRFQTRDVFSLLANEKLVKPGKDHQYWSFALTERFVRAIYASGRKLEPKHVQQAFSVAIADYEQTGKFSTEYADWLITTAGAKPNELVGPASLITWAARACVRKPTDRETPSPFLYFLKRPDVELQKLQLDIGWLLSTARESYTKLLEELTAANLSERYTEAVLQPIRANIQEHLDTLPAPPTAPPSLPAAPAASAATTAAAASKPVEPPAEGKKGSSGDATPCVVQ
jgi:hypothetical protein